MKYCPNCGTQISDEIKFCMNCGAQLSQNEQQYSQQNYQQVPAYQYQPQPKRALAAKVGFGGAIKRFFVNYVDFRGRASRSEYWWGYLFYELAYISVFILSIVLAVVWSRVAAFSLIGPVTMLLFYLLVIALAIPMLSSTVRRLHDAGYSGYYLLISLIPAGGIVLIVFLAQPSVSDNEWGPAAPGTLPFVYYGYPSGGQQNYTNQ